MTRICFKDIFLPHPFYPCHPWLTFFRFSFFSICIHLRFQLNASGFRTSWNLADMALRAPGAVELPAWVSWRNLKVAATKVAATCQEAPEKCEGRPGIWGTPT